MAGPKSMSRAKEYSLKRQAIQVAGMLPDDPDDAKTVLGLAGEIIDYLFKTDGRSAGVVGFEEISKLLPLKRPCRSSGAGGDGG